MPMSVTTGTYPDQLLNSLMPEVKTGHSMQSYVLLSIKRTLQASIDCLPFRTSHSTQDTGAFGDVVIK